MTWYVTCFQPLHPRLRLHMAYPLTAEMDTSSTVREIELWSLAGAAVSAIAFGARRRTFGPILVAAAAAPVAYRLATGRWPQTLSKLVTPTAGTREALSGSRGVRVEESIRIARPASEVYAFWRSLENLPRFMQHLDRVSETSDLRSYWVARGPAGVDVAWVAEIINDIPNHVIAWRSLPGSDVTTAGSVTFDGTSSGNGTRLTVKLQYEPPAGRLGAIVAHLFGKAPSQTIREDLERLKRLLEAGEVRHPS